MTPKQIISHYKTPTAFQKATGYTMQSLRNWKKANAVPRRAQIVIESISCGALKANAKR